MGRRKKGRHSTEEEDANTDAENVHTVTGRSHTRNSSTRGATIRKVTKKANLQGKISPSRFPYSQERSRSRVLPRSKNIFAKEWGSTFSGPGGHIDDWAFAENRQEIFPSSSNGTANENREELDPNRNSISFFLSDYLDPVILFDVYDLEKFCQDINLKTLEAGIGPAGCRRASWIDDRQFSREKCGGYTREYHNPLTASRLYQVLKRPVSSYLALLGRSEVDQNHKRRVATPSYPTQTDV
jgi:hypothetical protein